MDESSEKQVMAFVEKHMDTIPFKTLRHGEVEMSQEEKLIRMHSTLHSDPALFLGKWGCHLSQNTIRLFKVIKDNYEVDFYLDSLLYQEPEDLDLTSLRIQHHRPPPRRSAMQQLAQNRRYEFLQRELRHSDYFSDESIQLREPVLYDQFVGQYIPAKERSQPFEKEVTLVNRILSNMDRKYVEDRLHEQNIVNEEQFEEEEEEESDEDVEEKATPIVVTKKKNKDMDMEEASGEAISDEEESEQDMEALMEFREEQRQELIRLLEEKFLAGEDDFDYDQVDYNEEYDDLRQQEQDIHDRYFSDDD